MSHWGEETKTADLGGRARAAAMDLVVSARQGVRRIALPDRGGLVIGRDRDCEIVVDDPTMSRRHALLRIDDGASVEDLDSHNGVRIHGRQIPPSTPIEVAIGTAIELGTVLFVLVPRSTAAPSDGEGEIIASSSAMRATLDTVDRVATSDLSVLLLGETGVGKEVIAAQIHARSARATGPMIAVDCASLPPTLVEGVLFGHVRGAFTGATRDSPGLLREAHGGTVFLDELGELPLAVQTRLLRAIQEREVRPVGGSAPLPIDVRFIAATHRDLERASRDGTFRQDLYFRVAGATLRIAPLRERVADIAPLALKFAGELAASLGRRTPTLDDAAIAALLAWPWPGNVRELRSCVHRAVLLGGAEVISAGDLGLPTAQPAAPLRESMERFERAELERALELTGGHQAKAATLLGIGRRTLIEKLDKYGLSRPRKGR
jgi:two-component system response regulator AtoC